ncbi:site-specific DNA-methyltransferase [Sphaerotilus mobilis]|uniref:site-specific DNA-methyltransferase n=1 Tax=Sphaerotilus mobilis TaxID=47994 RepID=UPI001A9369C7|nr:site-specific DNA-methyltransferase [Sphaerotilus mobilis]
MQKIQSGDAETLSADLRADNLARLRTLFPELATEGPGGVAINVDVLKGLIGDASVGDADEKYGLTWHGKRAARQLALTPSSATLRPCREDSVDWDTTRNLMIEGDNLEVLKLLQRSYAGKVKLIYIDPPYNTGKDFVYPDNFQDSIRNYLELTGQVEGGRKISSNPEASGRFHTDWLNMMYPRLKLAHSLLRDDGVLCVSIDDCEVAALRQICMEIFGGENFLGTFVWQKRVSPDNDERHMTATHDYVVCFMKNKSEHIVQGFSRTDHQDDRYLNPDSDPRGAWTSSDLTRREYRERDFYEITLPSGRKVTPAAGRSWSVPPEKFKELVADKRIWFGPAGDSMPRTKRFLTEVANRVVPVSWLPRNLSGDNQAGKKHLKSLFPEVMDIFETPKPVELIATMVQIFSGKGDVVLDFFAGTGTTGEAVARQNRLDEGERRFVLVQLPEQTDRSGFGSIAGLTRERLRRSFRRIREESPLFTGDLGFKSFRLDTSNLSAWTPRRDDLVGTLFDHLEHVLPDRSDDDLLHEMLLKLGYDLCVPIQTRRIAGKAVQRVGDGVLVVCLDRHIGHADAESLALGIADWLAREPVDGEVTCLFRDSAFADDVAKSNLAAILEQHGVKRVRSL